ncbi:MAG: alkaline phosphatase family protein [Oscillospiraceae bacterium]|nr:alkaline phosphatase family protein [Oscillospiraceae bacterium]
MGNKVLLLVADGMRPDFVMNCGNPFVDEFLSKSVYTMEGQTVMPSVTLPCHMSLFHSVAPDRHGIITNTYVPQVRPVKGLCEVLKDAGKTSGMFYDWEEIRDLVRPANITRASFYSGGQLSYENTMPKNTAQVIECLKENYLDFTFVYFGLPDSLGHGIGFTSEEYRVGISSIWDNIKLIYDAMPEEYSMIITTDHGGHGRGHGSDCPEDMTIPIIFGGELAKQIDADKIKTANIIDIAPTIVAYMGVNANSDWEGINLSK